MNINLYRISFISIDLFYLKFNFTLNELHCHSTIPHLLIVLDPVEVVRDTCIHARMRC